MFSDKVNVLMLSKVLIYCRIVAYCKCRRGGLQGQFPSYLKDD